MPKKKVNPNRKPATQADVQKARAAGIKAATAIMMYVMREKFGFGTKRLTRLWDEVSSLSEEMIDGRVKLDEITDVLLNEYGIDIK